MQQWGQNWSLSRAERNGIIVLSVFILLLLAVRLYLVHWTPELPKGDLSVFQSEIADFEADTLLELNTATVELLQELPSIGPSMAEKIVAHREALGGFSYPEQLLDIPGIGNTKLDGLLPFITIDTSLAKIHRTKPSEVNTFKPSVQDIDTATVWPIKLLPGETIELNSASIDDLKRLPGIGQAYAERILAYRTLLGGFHSIGQLQEIGGIGQAKFASLEKHLSLNIKSLKLLNINTAPESELLNHPYTSKAWVQEVVANRPFNNLDNLPNGTDPRLKPYLVL